MAEICWSIDSTSVKDNMVFGFGWMFHPNHLTVSINVRLELEAHSLSYFELISADALKPRQDVQSAYRNQPHALNSGFVFFGSFKPGAKLHAMVLVCKLADGTVIDLPVPSANLLKLDDPSKAKRLGLSSRRFFKFFKRGLALLRAGQFSDLFAKIKRLMRWKSTTILRDRSMLEDQLEQDERKDVCLIIDHDLGGGANQYSERMVNSFVHSGRTVLILSYHVAALSYALIVKNKRMDQRFSIPDKNFLLDAIKTISIAEIIYNNAVSFQEPEALPQLLIRLHKATTARLKILVHDFFLVCPSHFLLDSSGKFCNVPNPMICAVCLPKNPYGFASLFYERNITKWRSVWGALLANADEIVAFSNSSKEILLKAYPHIKEGRISVTPHTIPYLKLERPQITNTSVLCIGIVGQIGFHKGSEFVQALSREISRRGFGIKIVIIGSIECAFDPAIVRQTGPYRQNDLPHLIKECGANIFLFPSIWPETFSYVTQELVEMDLPVACFNLGAPAERLSNFTKGIVLNSIEPETVLDELINFHQKVYLSTES